ELSGSETLQCELRRVERQVTQEHVALGTNRRKNMIADFWQDLRFGVRTLGKHPGFTAVAALTLALGIGVNTTIFSFFNFLIRPPQVKDPDSLARLEYRAANRWGEGRFSFPDYIHFRDHARSYTGLIAFDGRGFLLDNQSQDPQRILATFVSDNFF